MSALVSVIIPNFNNATLLDRSIDSCLIQGELLKEIIVVDDHSTDDSLAVLEAYQSKFSTKMSWYINPDKGTNSARNFGFSKSQGTYIQWLDSDDFLMPGKFEAQVVSLEKTRKNIAYSDFRIDFYNDSVCYASKINRIGEHEDYLEELLKDHWNASHSYLLTRSMALKMDACMGWNPNTFVGQDREYFTLAGLHGAEFDYVSGVFAVYNKRDKGSISAIEFETRLEQNQLLEERFRLVIEENRSLPVKKKKKYFAILDTHKLKACFYHPEIRLTHAINPFRISWGLMHWKMRLIMPFIYIRKHLEFYL